MSDDKFIPTGWAVPDDWARKIKAAESKKPITPQGELQDALNQAACEIAQVEPSPGDWGGWVSYLLEQLQVIADNAGRRDEFEAMLRALQDDLSGRIKGGKW